MKNKIELIRHKCRRNQGELWLSSSGIKKEFPVFFTADITFSNIKERKKYEKK